jgi:hypothetical protein
MPVVTATEVTIYSNISASAATITASGLIPIVQERITHICNSYFTTDIQVITGATFNATAGTITLDAESWSEFGFADGDEIYVYHSYRNDGYAVVSTFSGSVGTVATGYSVVDELSGRSILFALVSWPLQVKRAAAQMVAYDYEVRPKQTPGVRSFTLGPYSETYGSGVGQGDNSMGAYGYPAEIVGMLPLTVSIR